MDAGRRLRTTVRLLGAVLICALGVALAPLPASAASASTGQQAGTHRHLVVAQIGYFSQQVPRVQDTPAIVADSPVLTRLVHVASTSVATSTALSRAATASPARGPPGPALR